MLWMLKFQSKFLKHRLEDENFFGAFQLCFLFQETD